MTGQEFANKMKSKYKNTAIDYDGGYGVQCVDFAKLGFKMLGIANPPATGNGWAHGYWYNRNHIPEIKNNFVFITGIQNVKAGDIVIYDPAHVAIALSPTVIMGYNQNGRNDGYTEKSINAFKGFLGALRYKKFTESNVKPSEPKKQTVSNTPYEKCADDVIKGMYGNGHDNRATAIYNRVRQEVNNICLKKVYTGGYITDIARDVINGKFGNGHENRKNKIYEKVRQAVNKKVG